MTFTIFCNTLSVRVSTANCERFGNTLHGSFPDQWGYHPRDITLLTDEGNGPLPTRRNILHEMYRLVSRARAGDSMFIHCMYSMWWYIYESCNWLVQFQDTGAKSTTRMEMRSMDMMKVGLGCVTKVSFWRAWSHISSRLSRIGCDCWRCRSTLLFYQRRTLTISLGNTWPLGWYCRAKPLTWSISNSYW